MNHSVVKYGQNTIFFSKKWNGVIKMTIGCSSSWNPDGTIHETFYDGDYNIRYSRDRDPITGDCTNRHIVDQDDNSKANLSNCNERDDDYAYGDN